MNNIQSIAQLNLICHLLAVLALSACSAISEIPTHRSLVVSTEEFQTTIPTAEISTATSSEITVIPTELTPTPSKEAAGVFAFFLEGGFLGIMLFGDRP